MAQRYRSSFLPAALLLAGHAALAAPLLITTENSPPSSMLAGDQVVGRETDKIREMMARTGTSYRIELLPWKRAYTMAQSQANTCVYSTSRSDVREVE